MITTGVAWDTDHSVFMWKYDGMHKKQNQMDWYRLGGKPDWFPQLGCWARMAKEPDVLFHIPIVSTRTA